MSSQIKKVKNKSNSKDRNKKTSKDIPKHKFEGVVEDDVSNNTKNSNTNNTNNIIKNTQIDIPKENIPIIVELPNININIFETNNSVKFSTNLDYPRSEYGFHHFIHNNKNKTEKLKVFEGKKKVYLVFNRFEKSVDNYEKSINVLSKKLFSTINPNSKLEIIDDGFFKLWEILMLFNLIDINKEKFNSLHLAEKTGSFIQSCIYFRDMYCKKNISKNDKFYDMSIKHDGTNNTKDSKNELDEIFTKHYKNEKPQRFVKQSGGKSKNTHMDITNPKFLKLVGGQLEEKVDLITGNCQFDWTDENINTQEQESFRLLIAEITACVKFQKKGGNFVCKFFETFTKTSLKIVSVLMSLYDKIYWIKPLSSELYNSEKYAVCMGFKFSDKDKEYKEISKKMEEIMKSLHNDKTNKVVDIFLDFEIPKILVRSMIELNKETSNQQLKNIGEIISFVEKEVYSGDEYHDKREEQIKGSNFWSETFLPDSENLNTKKNVRDKILESALSISNKEIEKLNKLLVHVENQN